MSARDLLTPEQRAAIAEFIGDAKPATSALVVSFGQSVRDRREHEHPQWEDFYCMNLSSYMGERMGPMLRRLLDAEAELEQLRRRVEAEECRCPEPAPRCEGCNCSCHKAEEKSTADSGVATPGPRGRVAQLLDAIRTHGGTWTTNKAFEVYRLLPAHGGMPLGQIRTIARGDLRDLAAWGHLTASDASGRREYRLAKGGA
ncbi:hypothetical protein [Streptomyces sp. NPDC101149]|uniref:hypothetical protein n=1 Tax=Streptomyces sp. NPDC101149 TaxID=3366113 RepID=UPI00380AF10B